MNNINFSRQLIKGRIAETIFDQMFRESGKLTVLPIGYEHTMPELAQYQHHVYVKQVLENIRNAPDFALISQDKTQVYLVEVKYRHQIDPDENLRIAKELSKKWNPLFLFIATHENFYFDPCTEVINNGGVINQLSHHWISEEIQKQYQTLLREFTD